MMTFDDCIIDHFSKDLITEETAIAFATNRAVVNRGIDAVKKARGDQAVNIGTLEVDRSYGKAKMDTWKR